MIKPETVIVKRRPTLLPCAPRQATGKQLLEGRGSSLNKASEGCGAVIEFHPNVKCPNCDRQQQRQHPEAPTEGSVFAAGSTLLVDADTDEVVAAQIVSDTLGKLADKLARALRAVRWDSPVNSRGGEGRVSGMVVTHRTFGFTPPVALRRRYGCSRSLFDAQYPDIAELVNEFVVTAQRTMIDFVPSAQQHTVDATASLIPEAWRMAGTSWTSGIINNTAALPYHRDSGNVKGSWSAMLGARRDVTGGVLHLFDYDAYLAVPNGSISIFDGQSILHGVTPMRATSHDAYRYTAVAYARRAMSVCCPDPADEPARAKRVATEAQERLLQKMRNKDEAGS